MTLPIDFMKDCQEKLFLAPNCRRNVEEFGDNTETLLEIILDDIANRLYEGLPSKVGFGPKL